MKWTYLLIDFFTLLIPLVFSFHPRLNFYKTWKAFFPAVFLSGLLFAIWDARFTSNGVWGFNAQYLTGINIGNLPVEELLFFFSIPYACVFTFYCMNKFMRQPRHRKWEDVITVLLIVFFGVTGVSNHQKLYPFVTFTSLSILLAIARYVLRVKWLGRFYIVYIMLFPPFLLVNGILTGTGLASPVVWYNESEIIGVRIGTIPVEDIFYGMELILLNLLLYRLFPHLDKLKRGKHLAETRSA